MQNITYNNLDDSNQFQGSKIPPWGGGEAGLRIIECPRDAMQGWPHFIPTEKKIKYINALLKCGFHTLDFGSFVSPKAIPQLADTAEVIRNLQLENSNTKLLAIIANERGAAEAVSYDQISYLGFPFSISETFQQRNTNSSVDESLKRVEDIQELCMKNKKELVVYISMGFGNPYGDEYNEKIVLTRTKQIAGLGVKIISIADTVGLATAPKVSSLMKSIVPQFADVEIGVHLHSAPADREAKIEAALNAGCTRFDSALKGIGGCPMAGNDLVGNMDTEVMINYFESKGYLLNIDKVALKECSRIADRIFI
jgi:hydroxymethylglutaryl-CoA lyase